MRDLPKLKLTLTAPEKFGNLAEKIDSNIRRTMAEDLITLIKIDETSMSPWLGKAKGYLDKMEAERAEAQSREQQGAGEEDPPSTEMTLSAVVQFSARATGALLGEPDLAKASETGSEPLAAWVSTQLRTKDPNWILDTDPLVVHMSVTGLAWRKRAFEEYDKVFHSHFLPCTDVIVNSNVRNIERAPRITHQFERYPYEIERSIERKHWVDYDPIFDEADPQKPKQFYEIDAWLDLDHDGIDEPWTVVISRDDFAEVVKIAPRWSKKTVVDNRDELFFNPIRRFYPYRFLPDPKGGFFPMGFGKLLSRVESAADSLLTSITDTAKSEAQNGGVMSGSGVGLSDSVVLKNNEITTLPMDGAPLANRFQAFPVKSVSAGSVTILEKIMTLADRLSGSLNLLENAPASMSATLAKGIIDGGQQVQSAVHRRMCASLTQEIHMFVQMADAYNQLPNGVQATTVSGVAVTADPQLATEMQRAALASIYMELIKQALEGVPWSMQELQLRITQVLRLPNGEKLIGQPKSPEASPWEKMQGFIGLQKQQNEKIKITGAVAVQLTQALLNMVNAAGGMQNNQAALLTMAQLEKAVQEMMEGAGNASNGLDGMAAQPGNSNANQLPPPPPGGNSADVPGGQLG